jgi:hypothetical protein
MTKDEHLGRKVKNPEAAKSLDAVFEEGDPKRGSEAQSGV